jgi:hypothetical protein
VSPIANSNNISQDIDYRLVLVLRLFIACKDEPYMQNIIKWMKSESLARIEYFVIKIQCLLRKRISRKRRESKINENNLKLTIKKQNEYAVKIQNIFHIFINQLKTALIAQKTIIKYVPLNGNAYWFNPKTKVKTYFKPKILHNLDAYVVVAVPEAGSENLIYCCYCANIATINCNDCEDSMCAVCYESMHCRGQKKFHNSNKIPVCSYCKYQVAVKKCSTCMLKKPSKGTMQETMTHFQRGLFCDACFIFEHDLYWKKNYLKTNNEFTQSILSSSQNVVVPPSSPSSSAMSLLSTNNSVSTTINKNLINSKSAYLVREEIQRKIITSHSYENLMQTCEECCSRGSVWRCIDCAQVYCNKCLVGLHSIGGCFSRHSASFALLYFENA